MKHLPGVAVVSNPEFLREGSAVRDFEEPPLIVVGGSDAVAVQKVAALYADLKLEPCLVTLRTAEMIKYACNAFHALKISFANEIGALCDRLEVPAQEVMQTLCQDEKLNLSARLLTPPSSLLAVRACPRICAPSTTVPRGWIWIFQCSRRCFPQQSACICRGQFNE